MEEIDDMQGGSRELKEQGATSTSRELKEQGPNELPTNVLDAQSTLTRSLITTVPDHFSTEAQSRASDRLEQVSPA